MGPEESKQMNLAVLEKFVQAYNSPELPIALGNVLHISGKRHGGGYAAFLVQLDNTTCPDEGSFAEMVEDDDFWQGHLRRIPWFPLRHGDTVGEALQNLVKFLDEELTEEPRELMRWQSMCCSLALKLVEAQESFRPDLDLQRWERETFSRKS